MAINQTKIKMKKFITLLFLFIVTISTNAQEAKKQVDINTAAKENLSMIVDAFGKLEPKMFTAIHELFLSKHTRLQAEGVTEADKKAISKDIDEKLRATFPPEQLEIILNKKGFYDKLIN